MSVESNRKERAKRVKGLCKKVIIVTDHRLKLDKEVNGRSRD